MKLNAFVTLLCLLLAAPTWALDPVPAAPAFDGPNCWNAALKAVRILPHFRFSSAKEINFYSKSPLCTFIDYSERQPGDIGLIRGEQVAGPGEVHAFVIVEGDRVYSKNGLKKTTPYVYWPMDQILRGYQSPPQPLSFMRCHSLAEYLEAHTQIPRFFLETLAEITSYEKDLEQFVMKGTPLTFEREDDITPITVKYLENLQLYQDEVTSMPQEDRTFIQGVIRERLQSIAGQMNYADKSYLLVELGLMFGRLP